MDDHHFNNFSLHRTFGHDIRPKFSSTDSNNALEIPFACALILAIGPLSAGHGIHIFQGGLSFPMGFTIEIQLSRI